MTVNPVIFFHAEHFSHENIFAFYFSADAARMKMHYIIPFRLFCKMHHSFVCPAGGNTIKSTFLVY